jgi:hypothetical protein
MFTLLALLGHPTAEACSLAGPSELAMEPTSDDRTPPAAPELGAVRITRGRGPRATEDGAYLTTSCDDIGFIVVTVARPVTDPDGEAAVGYRFALASGALPAGLVLPAPTAAPWLGPALNFAWIDEATDEQDSFAFTLEVIPVDAAGNEGPPLIVELADGGEVEAPVAAAGCATAPGPAAWSVLLALVAARRGSGRAPRQQRPDPTRSW